MSEILGMLSLLEALEVLEAVCLLEGCWRPRAYFRAILEPLCLFQLSHTHAHTTGVLLISFYVLFLITNVALDEGAFGE